MEAGGRFSARRCCCYSACPHTCSALKAGQVEAAAAAGEEEEEAEVGGEAEAEAGAEPEARGPVAAAMPPQDWLPAAGGSPALPPPLRPLRFSGDGPCTDSQYLVGYVHLPACEVSTDWLIGNLTTKSSLLSLQRHCVLD